MNEYKSNALKLSQGNVNLTTGITDFTTILGEVVYVCIADGTLTVTWADDNTDIITMLSGDAVSFINIESDKNVKSVAVTTGTFHKGI